MLSLKKLEIASNRLLTDAHFSNQSINRGLTGLEKNVNDFLLTAIESMPAIFNTFHNFRSNRLPMIGDLVA